MTYVYRNKEVASLRGVPMKENTWLIFMSIIKNQARISSMKPSNIRVELIKLNPYEEVTQARIYSH